jgi:carbon storage regulator
MLVLSRKPGERILIGDNVAITVVRIGPNNVRIGIEAPRDLNIVREELCAESSAIVADAVAEPVAAAADMPHSPR